MSTQKKIQGVESIAVKEFFGDYGDQLKLRLVTSDKTLSRSTIREKSINRPALAVTGYFKYFANKRIQLLGAGEMAFFPEQCTARRKSVIETMVAKKIPCVVVSRSLAPTQEMIDVLNDAGVPLFRTPLSSKAFTTEVTVLLEERFAARTSLHGTLLEIRGVGTLVRGESGAGKSEAALALIERGHSLVADDLVLLVFKRSFPAPSESSSPISPNRSTVYGLPTRRSASCLIKSK